MADFYVPIATGLFTDLNDKIAAGPPKPDMSFISNALENYDKGGQIKQDIGLRNVFQDGYDPATAAQKLLQIGGASQIPNAMSLQKFGIASQLLGNNSPVSAPPSSATAIPSTAPSAQPTANTQPQAQPTTAYDIQTGTRMPPGQNLTGPGTTITGIDYGQTAGGGGLTPRMVAQRSGGDPSALAHSLGVGVDEVLDQNDPRVRESIAQYARGEAQPASFSSRFAAAGGPTLNQGQPVQPQQQPVLNQGQPVQPQAQPQQAPQQAPQAAPTMTEANAARYEQAANAAYQKAQAASLVDPAMSAAFKAQGDAYMNQASIIRKTIGKNSEQTPEQKNSADPNAPNYASTVETNKQDTDTFQKRYTGLQAAGEQSYNGQQKVQLMKQLTMQPAFYSGPLHEGVQTFNQFKSIFGSNPSSALPQEAFNKVANDLLQEQVKAMGQSGVGRVLQSEVNIMKQSIASLGITPQSNRALAEILSRVYKQNQDIAGIARNVNAPPGKKNQALDAAVSDYLKQHPLFTQQEIQHPETLGAPDAPPQSAQWSPQQKRQWAQGVGLKPGDPIRFNGQVVSVP